jgi:hypothetical protein
MPAEHPLPGLAELGLERADAQAEAERGTFFRRAPHSSAATDGKGERERGWRG